MIWEDLQRTEPRDGASDVRKVEEYKAPNTQDVDLVRRGGISAGLLKAVAGGYVTEGSKSNHCIPLGD